MPDLPAYHLTCSDQCLLKSRPEVNDALASGRSFRQIMAVYPGTNLSNLSRHKKHMVIEGAPAVVPGVKDTDRVPHVQVLEAIIAAGWQNREKWKPTIGDTMKAMDMYQKMTQGSAFQDLLDALASDISDDEGDFGDIEAPEAVSEVANGG